MIRGIARLSFCVALATSAACTVHQSDAPPVTGPSEFAQSVTVTATPDTVKLGVSATSFGESSAVSVQVRGPDGSPLANKAVRLDVAVGGVLQNCGLLSLHDVVTGSDGRATAVFVAPGLPMPLPECANFSGSVEIFANLVGTNFQTTVFHSVSIRMVPPSVIYSPGGGVVSFLITPNPAKVNTQVAFNDAGSTAAPGRTITAYTWDFTDGTRKFGRNVTHDFYPQGVYGVTLTITDDIGQQTFKDSSVTIIP